MASKKEIEITAKIANIQKIRDELSKVKINIKVDSQEFKDLQKMAQKGLTIKIDFKLPKEFKQLLDLQRNGINIRTTASSSGSRTGASSSALDSQMALNASEVARLNAIAEKATRERRAQVDRQLKALFAAQSGLDGSSSPLVNGARIGSSNRIYPGLSAKGQQFFTKQTEDQFRIVSRQMERLASERRKDVDRQLKDLFAAQAQRAKQDAGLDGTFSELVNGIRPGSASKINPGIALKRQREQERIIRAQQRAADNLEKANEFVRNNPLEALLGTDTRTVAAKKFGVSRGSITANPNFFDPKRVFKGDNFKDILYTSLLGGPGQGLGAAVGAATFDRGGTLIGANVAAATIAVFEKIADSMGKAIRAGAQYEQTVTGITGIFQATSEVIDREGNPVDIKTALNFQRQRAQGIQDVSQKALLPLGISGEAASALTKSFVGGLAQRGIAPDEKSSGIILQRLGAAIQTLQPELANDANALQRTVEDIIGGSPQATRTELGSAIKGLAPGLFTGGSKSIEDIVKATDALEQLVIALKNNDTASVQWQKTLGSLQLAQQDLGRGLLEGVAPGLKAVADELNRTESQSKLKELGTAIGEVATGLIRDLLPAITAIAKVLPTGVKVGGAILEGSTGFGPIGKALGNVGKGLRAFGIGPAFGDEGLEALNAKRAEKGQGALVRGADGQLRETPTGNTTGDEGLAKLNEKRASRGQSILRRNETTGQLVEDTKENQDLFLQKSLQTLFKSANTDFGITDPSEDNTVKGLAENRFRGLNKLRADLASRKGRSSKDILTNAISLNSQEIGIRRERQSEKNELFGDSEAGQLSRALSEKGSLRDILKLAEDNVAKRKQLLTIASTSTETQIKDEEAIAKARLGIRQAEEEVIKIRKEALAKEKEISEKRINLLRRQASAEDNGTTAGGLKSARGLRAAGNVELKDIDQRIADAQRVLNDPLASAQEKANARNQITEDNIARTENRSADTRFGKDIAQKEFTQDTTKLRNNLRTGSFQDAQKSADIGLKQLDISTRELAIEQEKLALATKNANKALTDFSEQSRLRELGRQGEEISAAEAIVASGGSVPSGVDASLVRGSDTFDPEARAAFERRVAEEKFGQVKSQNDYERLNEEGSFGDTAKGLRRNVKELALDKERQNLKPEEFDIQRRSILRSKASNALSEEQSALEEYQNDPNNPDLKANYFKAKSAREAIEKEQESLTVSSPATVKQLLKKGKFAIDGQSIAPQGTGTGSIDGIPIGAPVGDGEYFPPIASNDIGSAILGGIGGSGAYGRAKAASDKGTQAATDILRGLGKDAAGRLKEDKEKGDRGNSIFDDLTALKPLTQSEMTQAFADALNQQFV